MERMPVYVKVDEYDDVLRIMNSLQAKLEEAKGTIMKIHDLKNEEDHQLEIWQNALEELEKKLDFINNSLNEPEQF